MIISWKDLTRRNIYFSSDLKLGKDVQLEGVQTSEGIVTPTDAAAAGDINVTFPTGDNMGNNNSVPVVAMSMKTVENGNSDRPTSYSDSSGNKKGNKK